MSKAQTTALEDTESREAFRRSGSPAAVRQPVQVVGKTPSPAAVAALSQPGEGAGNGFRRSEPPADVIQPVQVVTAAQAAPAQAQATTVAGPTAIDLPLSLKEADYTDEIGEEPDAEHEAADGEAAVTLDNQAMYEIIREVALAHSGDDLYSAISTDREYDTPGQPAYRQRHFGLAFGLCLFSQESGRLGSVLRLMHGRAPDKFAEIFGTDADALLQTTNAKTPEERLKPVGGQVLWSPDWVKRFQQAGAVAAFQAAQNEEAIEGSFRPMLNIAFGLGFVTDRALGMVFDRVVTRGLGAGLRWVVQAAGPLRTQAQRAHALEVLDFEDLGQFQTAVGWSPQNGQFGPETHAALVGALRRQGAAVLPTTEQLECALVAAASGSAKQRLIRLRDSTKFRDVAHSLG